MSERRLLELELARARRAIQRADTVRNLSQLLQNGDVLSSDIYHNPNEFYQISLVREVFVVYTHICPC
uniref:Uncharacterized protein n=1 Tax=Helianthus annuus TaxID=4232 RepID=A0A251UMN1_HELAN